MALLAGTVVVLPDTSHIGTGLALDVYDKRKALMVAHDGWAQLAQELQFAALTGLGNDSVAIAEAVVSHVTSFAEVNTTVAAGIPVSVTVAGVSGTGSTSSIGTGTGTVS